MAGISVSTVSNFLNGRPERMRPETVERIETAIARLGYRPSWAARQLKRGSVPVIGLLVPSVANPSHGALARAVEVAAEAQGYQVLLGNTLRDVQREEDYARDFLALGLKGLIIGSSPLTFDHLEALIEGGLSIVALDMDARHEGGAAIDTVSLDNRRAGYIATRHLLDHGHRRIGYVSGATRTTSRRLRAQGYLDALSEAGIAPDPELISESAEDFGFDDIHAAESGRIAATRLLSLAAPPTAILGMNDMHALGACAALRDNGISVPRDISVVGIDDIAIAGIFNPPLTTVHQPFEAVGREAVRCLVSRLAGEQRAAINVVIEPQLVQRGSVHFPQSGTAS